MLTVCCSCRHHEHGPPLPCDTTNWSPAGLVHHWSRKKTKSDFNLSELLFQKNGYGVVVVVGRWVRAGGRVERRRGGGGGAREGEGEGRVEEGKGERANFRVHLPDAGSQNLNSPCRTSLMSTTSL